MADSRAHQRHQLWPKPGMVGNRPPPSLLNVRAGDAIRTHRSKTRRPAGRFTSVPEHGSRLEKPFDPLKGIAT